jgi:alpha-glucosidase
MNQYRDFENDHNSWGYDKAAEFLGRLHANGQHFVPIVDSAVYIPNPSNASDAYPTYDRGVAANAFMLNPDGSTYIGAVWPGYTGKHSLKASTESVLTSHVKCSLTSLEQS